MRKRKMTGTPEERVTIVEQYLNGKISRKQAAQKAQVSTDTIQRWCTLYENEGPTGLLAIKKNRNYSQKLKQLAVQEYFFGRESLIQIAQKYGLRNKKQLQDWIKRYTTHGNFKSESGGSKVR